MEPINLVLFGDQTVEKLPSIQALVRHSKTSPSARRFLREATDIIQLDFAQLSKEDRAWNHDFASLLGLAEENHKEKAPNGILATVLMCIGRLGELIVYAEEDPSILGSSKRPVEVLAYCTGLLPAAALVASVDTSELFSFAREIISITFRMALEIKLRMRLVDDSEGSWATTIVGRTIENTQPILDKFHESQNIPFPRRVAISVVSTGWLTIVAAPSTLKRLMEWSTELSDAPKILTDTNGPIHTEYLPRFDMEKVLGTSPLLDTPITSKARIISPGSCKPYEHRTLRGLLSEMIIDIVHNILRLNETTDASLAGIVGKGKVSLTVAGPTGHLAVVQKAMQKSGIEYSIRSHKDDQIERKRGGSDRIAIVGMSGRFPGSESIEGFWEDLLDGKCQIKKIPKTRFDLDVYYDATGERKNSTTTQHGAFLDRPGFFDNRLFNVSPREALQMGPNQRLLLTTSYEALEMAGYFKDATLSTESNRIATYFGQASEDWTEVLNNEGVDIYYVPGLSRAFAPSRVSYQYKFGGGSYALDAACATSTTAIQLACSSLIARECDTALAGGGSILMSPNAFSGLSRSGMTSNTGGCRTYHDDADGYARGEGIGVVVLKRLEDAVADNDNILAVIRGSARTYTTTSTSITHPSAESQARIYDDVLRQTSVDPNEIAYVEMHGTGTQAGDYEEMTSVIKVMAQHRLKDNPLTVGAVKANVGHGEGVAGVTSLIKSIMMMRDRKIPPQPNLPFKLNHKFPKLEKIHVQIAGYSAKDMVLKPSPLGDGKLKIMVNSFDASGGNTSLVIEEPPKATLKHENPLPCHVTAISGKTTKSLQENRKRLLDYMVRNPNAKLADIAYTLTARRMHESLRVTYTASTTRELTNLLRADIAKEGSEDLKRKPGNVVFAFTGQGSQYVGMGKELYKHSPIMRQTLHTYQQMAESQGLPCFIDLITGEKDLTSSTVCIQLAIVALEIAVAHVLASWGIKPDVVIGHSLGEYAALCVSGVLSVSDTLHLVGKRAELMSKKLTAGTFSMLAVAAGVADVTGGEKYNLEVACINSPKATVLSGKVEDISKFKNELEEQNIRSTVLKVPYGFHSPHINPILGEFEKIAQTATFSAPRIPIVSTLKGEVVAAGDGSVFSPSYLVRQAREKVNFVGALLACKDAKLATPITNWIETGPQPVCLSMIRKTLDTTPDRLLSTLDPNKDNWATVSSCLANLHRSGLTINWPEYHKYHKNTLSLLPLPTYAFDEKNFWVSYVERTSATQVADVKPKMIEAPKTPSVPGYPTTSLQWIEKEVIEGNKAIVTFASHTSEKQLYKAISGHIVNGLTICPLGVFCDMAISASQYAHLRLKPGKKVPQMSIFNVDMTHALVVPTNNSDQILKTTVNYHASENRAEIIFHSSENDITTENGTCYVSFGDSNSWKSQLSQTLFLLNARIESLKDLAAVGKAHRLLKPVVYTLFAGLVVYGKEYQGMDEVWLDSKMHDAIATVKLPPNSENLGNYHLNPYWSDTVFQLAGFLLNGSLKYPEDYACLSTGFSTWRSFEDLRSDVVYTTYVSMQEGANGIITGDSYVFADGKLIQAMSGIKFQKMKKIVLNSILLPGSPDLTRSSQRPKKAADKSKDRSTSFLDIPVVLGGDSEYSSEAQTPYCETPAEPSGGISTPASSILDDDTSIAETLLAIVAAECGGSAQDLESDTSFADLGVDSLMAITALSTLKKETGVELPGTFFLDNQTVGEARAALGGGTQVEQIPAPTKAVIEPKIEVPRQVELTQAPADEPSKAIPVEEAPKPTPPQVLPDTKNIATTKATLLQGSPATAAQKVFFLPDASGSPTSYIQLPSLGSDVCVYGVESPWIKSPAGYTCSVEMMADIFIDAIRKQQPSGPYYLGGFAIGALYAYEVARKLLEAQDLVAGLLIIDMAVTKPLSTGPLTWEQVASSGFLPPTGRQSALQKEHILNTIKAVTSYRPQPPSSGSKPGRTVLISSKSGLGSGKQSELAQWAQGDAGKGTRGWDKLTGEVEVQEVAADHFALLRYPALKMTGQICKEAVAKFRV